MYVVNEGNYGETCYKVYLNTGTAWLVEFKVYAYCEGEALEAVAEYVVDKGLDGLWYGHYEIEDERDMSESFDEFVERHNLIPCDKGVYLPLERMEVLYNETCSRV